VKSWAWGFALTLSILPPFGSVAALIPGREISLPANITEPGSEVTGAAISVSSEIAVCVQGANRSFLIVISGVEQTIFDDSADMCTRNLFWSPSGRILVTESAAGARVIDTMGGDGCFVSRTHPNDRLIVLGFVDRDKFALAGGHNPGQVHGFFRDTAVDVYDTLCTQRSEWIVAGSVSAGDASSISGEVVMNRRMDPIIILNARTGVIQNLTTNYVAKFADSGSTLCLYSTVGTHGATCNARGATATTPWDLGGKAIRSLAVASAAPIGTALEYTYTRNPFTEMERAAPLRWLIWDMQKQRKLGALNALQQKSRGNNRPGSAFVSAMSPSGDSLVVAGDNRLLVYRVVAAK
jgi:hypothetical protein